MDPRHTLQFHLMTRRRLVTTAAVAPLAASAATTPKNQVYELRKYHLRNTPDNQRQRTTQYMEKAVMPAFRRAGVSQVGFFSSMIAPDTPFLLSVYAHASLSAYEEAHARVGADAEFVKLQTAFFLQPGLNFMRYETSILRAFDGMPTMEIPEPGKTPRVFELRTYESNNNMTLKKKVGMFNDGEIAIFRKTGLNPLFFGTTAIGGNQPSLTYMLWYDDLATREKNWRTFGGHPDWNKLKATPGLSDAEIVSNISNIILLPLPFSPIR